MHRNIRHTGFYAGKCLTLLLPEVTSALDGGEWSASRPGRFTPRERAAVALWIGSWVGPRAVLDAVVKRKTSSQKFINK
jgi:hypothetical protein